MPELSLADVAVNVIGLFGLVAVLLFLRMATAAPRPPERPVRRPNPLFE